MLGQEVTKVDLAAWYPFQPTKDDFAAAATDCSHLIEKPTGKHGFVKVQGDRFVFEDGSPARFWGAQIGPWTKDETDYAVKCLRKRGINVVRMHGLGFLNRLRICLAAWSVAQLDRIEPEGLSSVVTHLTKLEQYLEFSLEDFRLWRPSQDDVDRIGFCLEHGCREDVGAGHDAGGTRRVWEADACHGAIPAP